MGAIAIFAVAALILESLAGKSRARASKVPVSNLPPKVETTSAAPIAPDVKEAIADHATQKPNYMADPLPGVDPVSWAEYVRRWERGTIAGILPDGRRGLYLIGIPTLHDQGYMTAPVKTSDGFQATWIPPFSQSQFDNSLPLQYRILREQALRHKAYIQSTYPHLIGKTVYVQIPNSPGSPGSQESDERPIAISLSGLMAVSKQAALSGLDKWLANPQTRKDNTTRVFLDFNGIF